ncbi:laccase-14-like [Salvia hispanica]|uniref:laccase-14-like n=1 Tax=Salvia hispanica TaxID=49212 RepID=UPI00200915C9|nr:laccase-14-like [Salvia hispanica]
MVSPTNCLFLCFSAIILLGGITPVQALVHRFEVRRTFHTRLCTNKSMLTVNGQFPGPTIYARRGELVTVDIINLSEQNITIHWHGVRMPRYPWADGTNLVTMCPITPGNKFRQRMILSDEEGTLFWHAHSDWSRATVYGAIIVLPPTPESYPFPKPHAEIPILLGLWWNAEIEQVYANFIAEGRDPAPVDAFLMNGQPGDLYPCSKQDTFRLKVEPRKTYLIRMVSGLMHFMVFFKIAGHNMTVVGMDGAYTKPLNTNHIVISPGQTIDFLLETNQEPSHYYMAYKIYTRSSNYTPSTAILEYTGNYIPSPSPLFPSYQEGWPSTSMHFETKLRSLADDKHPISVPMNITEKLFFTLSINLWPCNADSCLFSDRFLASINNISMMVPDTSILEAYYRGIRGVFTTNFPDRPERIFNFTYVTLQQSESHPRFATAVYMLDYNAEVEIVLQGTILGKGMDHPMHLHGYSVYLLGSGLGNFNEARDRPNLNLVDPPYMDTVNVPRFGWTVVRFKANNPGVWYMHCHYDRHQTWGMRMVFIVKDGDRPEEKMLPPPPDMPRCDMPGGEVTLGPRELAQLAS